MRRVFAAVLAAGLLVAGCSDAQESSVLTPAQTVTFLADNPDAILIDVRTPAEMAEGHLVTAIMLDALDPAFETNAQTLDPTATYVLYCRSGNRSAAAIEVLTEFGFTNLYDAGAYNALADAGIPTT